MQCPVIGAGLHVLQAGAWLQDLAIDQCQGSGNLPIFALNETLNRNSSSLILACHGL